MSSSESGRAADDGDGRRASSVRCHVSPFLDLEIGQVNRYYCPGCVTLLDVEVAVSSIEGATLEPVSDIHIPSHAIAEAAERMRREASVDAE